MGLLAGSRPFCRLLGCLFADYWLLWLLCCLMPGLMPSADTCLWDVSPSKSHTSWRLSAELDPSCMLWFRWYCLCCEHLNQVQPDFMTCTPAPQMHAVLSMNCLTLGVHDVTPHQGAALLNVCLQHLIHPAGCCLGGTGSACAISSGSCAPLFAIVCIHCLVNVKAE
jgi:hypothetical protein